MSGLTGLLEIFGKKDDKDKSDAIQNRVTNVDKSTAFLDPMGGGVVVDNKDNVINTYIPEDIKKTIGTGDAGGIIKKKVYLV